MHPVGSFMWNFVVERVSACISPPATSPFMDLSLDNVSPEDISQLSDQLYLGLPCYKKLLHYTNSDLNNDCLRDFTERAEALSPAQATNLLKLIPADDPFLERIWKILAPKVDVDTWTEDQLTAIFASRTDLHPLDDFSILLQAPSSFLADNFTENPDPTTVTNLRKLQNKLPLEFFCDLPPPYWPMLDWANLQLSQTLELKRQTVKISRETIIILQRLLPEDNPLHDDLEHIKKCFDNPLYLKHKLCAIPPRSTGVVQHSPVSRFTNVKIIRQASDMPPFGKNGYLTNDRLAELSHTVDEKPVYIWLN